ncbi:hypothetical protein AMATHDRAFT_119280, partial [Amanita thiersii Skay4041]
TPSTPPRQPVDLQKLSIHDTPLSQGSGSHHAYDTQNTRPHYYPYLATDIATCETISFNDFISVFFAPVQDETWNTVFNKVNASKDFKALIEAYAAPCKDEKERYPRF